MLMLLDKNISSDLFAFLTIFSRFSYTNHSIYTLPFDAESSVRQKAKQKWGSVLISSQT